MLEPPSDHLLKTLTELRLCSERELRRCRRHVKRLARDLPAFDSVWVDALVQVRKLTSFQARILDSAHPEHLHVGPCVLIDRLGSGLAAETFLARRVRGNERCVLKRIILPTEDLHIAQENLAAFVEAAGACGHPSIVVPHACTIPNDDLVVISHFVPGPHLAELLLRRGRFPADVVAEIARQLADGLAALHAQELCHGEVSLANVRLTKRGTAVLVDAGIGPTLRPEWIVHPAMRPERCDGTAPELIGTGNHPDSASDLYALGCLLWQLLAGRPPFPGGDPLAKLAAHQTRRIADVREWAPDTPTNLAELIADLTNPNLDERPHAANVVAERIGRPRRSGRRRLARFRATFQVSVGRTPAPAANRSFVSWPVAAAILFAVSGLVFTLAGQGHRSSLLNLANHLPPGLRQRAAEWFPFAGPNAPSTTAESVSDADAAGSATSAQPGLQNVQPIPAPDANGVIELEADGTYAAADISAVGRLTIRGAVSPESGDRCPRVLVSGEPCKIWAEQVRIENVHFVRQGVTADKRAPVPALLLVEAQNLTLSGCRFQSGWDRQNGPQPATIRPTFSVGWKMIDRDDPSGGILNVVDSLFRSGPALYCAAPPQRIHAENCLKTGAGAFLLVRTPPSAGRNLQIAFRQVTLRESGSMLSLNLSSAPAETGRILLETTDCVFDLLPESASLFELVAQTLPADWKERIELTGEGCLGHPRLSIATQVVPQTGRRMHLETMGVHVEGIVLADYEFTGPLNARATDSMIAFHGAPQRSILPPGIDVGRWEHARDAKAQPHQAARANGVGSGKFDTD